MSVGTAHACAVVAGDAVLCWGANRYGQLGVATPATSATPVAVPPPGSPAASVSAGGTHTCSLSRTGGAVCWGNPRNGRLGIGVFPAQGGIVIPAEAGISRLPTSARFPPARE